MDKDRLHELEQWDARQVNQEWRSHGYRRTNEVLGIEGIHESAALLGVNRNNSLDQSVNLLTQIKSIKGVNIRGNL